MTTFIRHNARYCHHSTSRSANILLVALVEGKWETLACDIARSPATWIPHHPQSLSYCFAERYQGESNHVNLAHLPHSHGFVCFTAELDVYTQQARLFILGIGIASYP